MSLVFLNKLQMATKKYEFDFFTWKDPTCDMYNFIGFFCFFITSAKSIYDLVVSEFVYKDTAWNKWNYRKIFHFLLPFSQIPFLVSIIVFSMYCKDILEQLLPNTIITSLAGYVLVLCFLINALHWAFLTSHSKNLKLGGCITGAIIIIFVIIPLCFEFLFGFYDDDVRRKIHLVELIYASLLNVIVTIVVFFSWLILHNRLKEFSGLHTINKLKTRLKCQMLAYISFFIFRALLMLAGGLVGYLVEENKLVFDKRWRHILFFFSAIFGDIPLALVMLHFLAHKTPSCFSCCCFSAPSTSSAGAGTGTSTGTGTGGSASSLASLSGVPQAGYQQQYVGAGKINSGEDSPGVNPQYINHQYINPAISEIYQSSEIIFTNTPPQNSLQQQHPGFGGYPQNLYPQNLYYISPQVLLPGMDPSLNTNSYYSPNEGFV